MKPQPEDENWREDGEKYDEECRQRYHKDQMEMKEMKEKREMRLQSVIRENEGRKKDIWYTSSVNTSSSPSRRESHSFCTSFQVFENFSRRSSKVGTDSLLSAGTFWTSQCTCLQLDILCNLYIKYNTDQQIESTKMNYRNQWKKWYRVIVYLDVSGDGCWPSHIELPIVSILIFHTNRSQLFGTIQRDVR